ncbi:MAG: acetate--CoA ligase family protein, partial [Anaerolineae bacterium]|nr:acetate--CoA ligase family protein [Anaerolineae bacterium]
LAAMWQRRQWLEAQEATIELEPATLAVDLEAARALLAGKLGLLSSQDAAALMAIYGIETPREGLAATPEDAARLADEIGYPVVLKIASTDIVHKTDVGGIVTELADAAAVKQAAADMLDRVRAARPDAQIDGVVVQAMITGGQEVIVGVTQDPQFGPLAMVGSGGTAVELMGDVAFALAPITPHEARAMLSRTTLGPVLKGYRGKPAADRKAIASIIVRLAHLASDLPQVREIEINPVLVRQEGEGAVAVDVRVMVED